MNVRSTRSTFGIKISYKNENKIKFLENDVTQYDEDQFQLVIVRKKSYVVVTDSNLNIKVKVWINTVPQVVAAGLALQFRKFKGTPVSFASRLSSKSRSNEKIPLQSKNESSNGQLKRKSSDVEIERVVIKPSRKSSSPAPQKGSTIAEILMNTKKAGKELKRKSKDVEIERVERNQSKKSRKSSSPAPQKASTIAEILMNTKKAGKELKRKSKDVGMEKINKPKSSSKKRKNESVNAIYYSFCNNAVNFKAKSKEQGAYTPFSTLQGCPLGDCNVDLATFDAKNRHFQSKKHFSDFSTSTKQLPTLVVPFSNFTLKAMQCPICRSNFVGWDNLDHFLAHLEHTSTVNAGESVVMWPHMGLVVAMQYRMLDKGTITGCVVDASLFVNTIFMPNFEHDIYEFDYLKAQFFTKHPHLTKSVEIFKSKTEASNSVNEYKVYLLARMVWPQWSVVVTRKALDVFVKDYSGDRAQRGPAMMRFLRNNKFGYTLFCAAKSEALASELKKYLTDKYANRKDLILIRENE